MDAEIVDQDGLGLTFVCEGESLGLRREIELFPNGKAIVVDSKNMEYYVNLLIQHRYVTSIAEQIMPPRRAYARNVNARNANVVPPVPDHKGPRFFRMNPPEFLGSQVAEDPQNFIDEVKKIFGVMQVTGNDRVKLASYQLKDVAHIWFTH
ncbi:hypothetical protein MTR67_002938 [Solanum verrucosum]|uniref:HECT-type E3 ubiquitin transferase n=1 Tax=Solanum verrucosum TaxID=315347 RepID=A0AAF0PR53_SOLVR|nr:hypothetical protein MTR67_002938 [Solanum verrucosum]